MEKPELSRRSFLRGHFLHTLQSEKVRQQGHNAILPPWADLAKFEQNCTACGECITACEMQIIVRGESGLPEIDFQKGRGECSFCGACVSACQVDIFCSTAEKAWEHQVSIQPSCLAEMGVECRSCEDYCPMRAIRFRRQLGGIAKPQLDLTMCNGCGACLKSCPSGAIKIMHNTKDNNATNNLSTE